MAPTPLLLICSIIKLIEKIYLYKALARIMCLLKCGPWLLQKIRHPRRSIHQAHNFYMTPTVRIFSLMMERLRQSTTGRNMFIFFFFLHFWINCISNTFQTVAIKIAKLNRKCLIVFVHHIISNLATPFYWKLCFRILCQLTWHHHIPLNFLQKPLNHHNYNGNKQIILSKTKTCFQKKKNHKNVHYSH